MIWTGTYGLMGCWISTVLNNSSARYYEVIKNVRFKVLISKNLPNLSFVGRFLTSCIREQAWVPNSQPRCSLKQVTNGPQRGLC